ncbi:MAG: amino acid permease [Candidatus Aenigmatarchaeota archaeon]|nr:amino acid permease [Candidatus Aenigmarchaeota archaeon]
MPKLKRELGLFAVTAYAVGNILGAGIYALIGEAAGLTGNSVWLSFVIGAIVASFTGLSYAELSSMMPRAAAEYVYLRKCGSKVLAFLIGWLILFTGVVSAATVALGFAGYFHGIFGSSIILTALSLIAVLSFLNFWGIKESSRFNILFTAVELFGLLVVIILGFSVFGKTEVNYFEISNGVRGLLAASALVFFAYIGFEDIANVSEETRNPKKVLAKAFILAVLITTVIYILTSIAAVTLVDAKELSASKSPLALAASKTFLGNKAFTVLSYVALFATANTVLVIMIVGTRMMYGMSRGGSLPKILGAIHKTRRTPHVAIIVFMLFSMLFVFFGEIDIVANITSLGAFVTFGLVNASLIWLRFKYPKADRPFKTPVNIGNFPVLAFLGLVTTIFMALQFSIDVMLYTGVAMASGLILYQLIERKIIS